MFAQIEAKYLSPMTANRLVNVLASGFPSACHSRTQGYNFKAIIHFHGYEEIMRTWMFKRAETSDGMGDPVKIFQKRSENFVKENELIIDFHMAERLYNMVSYLFVLTKKLFDIEQVDCEHGFIEVYPGVLSLVKPMFTGGWKLGGLTRWKAHFNRLLSNLSFWGIPYSKLLVP